MKERRIDPRLLCADLVQVSWKDASGREWKRVANLEDISISGICVQVERPILPGLTVNVSYDHGKFSGIVRYCLFRDIGYFLGIEFDEGCRWSKKHFRPRHLLNPRDLENKISSVFFPQKVAAGRPAVTK